MAVIAVFVTGVLPDNEGACIEAAVLGTLQLLLMAARVRGPTIPYALPGTMPFLSCQCPTALAVSDPKYPVTKPEG